jgi:hypothetical protein
MAGDLVAGIMLSQIIYWNLPNKEGKSKLMVFKHGEYWLAKGREEWWDEIRISPKQVDRALKTLRDDKKIITTKLYRFNGHPRIHIKLNWNVFFNALTSLLNDQKKNIEAENLPLELQHNNQFLPEKWSSFLPKGKFPFCPKGKMDFAQRVKLITETTTKTTNKKNITSFLQNFEGDNNSLESFDNYLEYLFKDSSKIINKLIKNLSGKNSDKQLRNFINLLVNEFGIDKVVEYTLEFEKHIISGIVSEYNTTYTYNFFKEKHMKANTAHNFKEFCTNRFGDKNGNIVYDFYKNYISSKNDSGDKVTKISDRRKKSVEYIISLCGEAGLLTNIEKFKMRVEQGELEKGKIFLTHFNNYVKKYGKICDNSPHIVIEAQKIEVDIVPRVHCKVKDRDYQGKYHVYNYDYLCTCGTVVDPWKKQCPQCEAFFNWRWVWKDMRDETKNYEV